MESGAIVVRPAPVRARSLACVSAGLFTAIAVAALTWAKWSPYSHKLVHIASSHVYPGHSMPDHAGKAGAAPSVSRAWDFTLAYGKSVWMALLAALLIAAAMEALLPRRWLLRALAGRGRWHTLRGGAAALPSMMCTCCSAPLATTLRREGVPTSSALAYWVGNPALNPAVLAFLAIVAPWQWMVTRLVAGAVLVFGLTAVVARLAGRSPDVPERVPLEQEQPESLGSAPARFAKALARLSVTLVPEYVVAVFAIGLLRGWLFPFGDGSALDAGILAVIVAAVVGTLVVIATAGEIPILQGLAVLGVGAGPIGALLITLPAISIPSIAMTTRAFTLRVTLAMAAAVAVTGLGAGALLWALGG